MKVAFYYLSINICLLFVISGSCQDSGPGGFLALGPLCTAPNYLDCHRTAQELYQQCSQKDEACQCYYIEVVRKTCIELCPTFHHETNFLLEKLCKNVKSIVSKLPIKKKKLQ